MAKAEGLAVQTPAVKRPKTGGRPPKMSGEGAIDDLIVDAERRGRLAALHDDTPVPAELAAFYLISSMSQLREFRKTKLLSEEDKLAERVEKAAQAAAKAAGRVRAKPEAEDDKPKGLRMIKLAEKGAIGSNQPVTYLMGDLKKFQKEHAGYGTFEVRLAAGGLLGWVSEAVPFFASPRPDRKGRPILQGKGWGMDIKVREKLVALALAGDVKCVWMPPAEAVHCIWADESEHKAFAKPWIALLKEGVGAAKAAIERTALHVVDIESRKPKSRRL